MSEQHRDPVRELEDQMRAADALIESLEAEVVDLRRDLERASAALRTSREEVAVRGQALEDLEESERARTAAEEEVRTLQAELNELRQHSADEQIRLRNEHTASTAALREKLAEKRRADLTAAESEKIAALREEFRKERAVLEKRHNAEVEDLKRSAQQWEESLREGYRELEERHKTETEQLRKDHAEEIEALKEGHSAEMEALYDANLVEIETLQRTHNEEVEALRTEAEGQKIGLERTLREEFGQGREEERRAEQKRHAAELQALRSAAASRELELQKELREAAESHRAEVEELRLELEKSIAALEERRKTELREVKRLAAGRERELRRAQAARLKEEKEEAERRISALNAQREADNYTLREQHTTELEKVRRPLEARLAAEEERRKSQVVALEERLEGMQARHESEARLYVERLKELEHEKVVDKGTAEQELERRLAEAEEERTRLEDRIGELQDAVQESGTLEAELRATLGAAAVRVEEDEQPDYGETEEQRVAPEDLEERLEEAEAARLLAEERAADLEERLREAEEESRRRAQELEEALEGLRKVSDPEQRLRSGISLFNASEHTRTVASISKALGLPKVHAGADGGPDSPVKKPVITFIWSDMAWRRYVSDPTEGVEEPRVYLIGAGDDPSDLRRPDLESNARMDARGRLILGVQAH